MALGRELLLRNAHAKISLVGARLTRGSSAKDARDEALKAYNRGVLMTEEGHVPGAIDGYTRAIELGDRDLAPKATFNLAVLHAQRGDVDASITRFEQAASTRHHDVAAKAAFNLGHILLHRGEPDRARHAYEQAVKTGHEEVAATARNQLARLPAACKGANGGSLPTAA